MVFLARASDAVLRRLVPRVEAAAACTTGCRLRYTWCGCSPRRSESYWYRRSDCSWAYHCYSRTCGNYPC